jgi:hypothetical protein
MFGNNNWLIIAIVFGIIFYVSWRRYKDKKWINKRFGANQILAMSFGIIFFTINSRGSIIKNNGFLLLLSDRLFFKSRSSKIELEILKENIKNIYHSAAHKGIDINQSVINIDFLTKDKKTDSAAFKVPYPPQWLGAIKSAFNLKP